MKKFVAILALVSLSLSAMAQGINGAGVYDKFGKLVIAEAQPCLLNVEVRYSIEHFTPGVYARYAQKYLGERASLSERKSVTLQSGAIALGKGASEVVISDNKAATLDATLPENRLSREVLTSEERASATADMIFSLRKHRLDLITGEAGENVFGAGLKSALEEIARLERVYLAMFYGESKRYEYTRTFDIVIDGKQSDYVVCRFNDDEGIVAADDLSGRAIVLHLDIPSEVGHPAIKPVAPKSKVQPVEYVVVPDVKCTLLVDATLLDEEQFALQPFARTFVGEPIK